MTAKARQTAPRPILTLTEASNLIVPVPARRVASDPLASPRGESYGRTCGVLNERARCTIRSSAAAAALSFCGA